MPTVYPRSCEGITSSPHPHSSSYEPLIMQSMIHYPRSDPRSLVRRVYIDWHNNNSLPDHLTFTIGPLQRDPGEEWRPVIDTHCRLTVANMEEDENEE